MKNQHLNTCKWTIPCVLANSSKPCIIQMNWHVWRCCPLVQPSAACLYHNSNSSRRSNICICFFKWDILFIPGHARHPEIIKLYSYIQKEGKNKHPENSVVSWDHTSDEWQLSEQWILTTLSHGCVIQESSVDPFPLVWRRSVDSEFLQILPHAGRVPQMFALSL